MTGPHKSFPRVNWKAVGRLLGMLVFAIALFCVGSSWRVSAAGLVPAIRMAHPFALVRNAQAASSLPDWPEVEVKDRLDVGDALLNCLSLFVSAATLLITYMLLVVAGMVCALYGILSGSWRVFGTGLFASLAGLFCMVLMPLAIVIMWFALLLQPCTPGYFFTWLLLGLPALLGGFGSNYLVLENATVIIMPRS